MRRNPIVVGLVAALALVLLAVLVVLPQGGRVERAEQALVEAESQLGDLQVELGELRGLAESGDLDARLASVRTQFPSSSDLPALFATLRDAARLAGVDLVGISPGLPTLSSVGAASVIPLGLTVQGEYFTLAAFLFELETLDRLARVNGVTIGPEGEGGRLSMQVTAEVYTTDTNAGPGTDPAPGTEIG